VVDSTAVQGVTLSTDVKDVRHRSVTRIRSGIREADKSGGSGVLDCAPSLLINPLFESQMFGLSLTVWKANPECGLVYGHRLVRCVGIGCKVLCLTALNEPEAVARVVWYVNCSVLIRSVSDLERNRASDCL
jgi:hypothetical protein